MSYVVATRNCFIPTVNYVRKDLRQKGCAGAVGDALEYIEWALNWPKIVQVVRSVEQGTVRTDMSWRP